MNLSLAWRRWMGALAVTATAALTGCAGLPVSDATPGASIPGAEASGLASGPGSASRPDVQASNTPNATDQTAVRSGSRSRTGLDALDPERAIDFDRPDAKRDLWQRIREGYAMPDLDSPLVDSASRWYAQRPEHVQRVTERSARYLFHIVEEVQRRGLPTELALLPFIESAFNPRAVSPARASGIWQFMPATGRDFDLKQNVFRDDRRSVLDSTRAALDYLTRLHAQFGHWHLALAAYNWGEGNLQRAIQRNERAGLPTDYESLRLPEETRRYVPKLQAVKNLVSRPQEYGVALTPIENHPYFLSVPVDRDIDVALAARLAGLNEAAFLALNPQHNKPVILAAGSPQILLPYAHADQFIREYEAHRGPTATWTAWQAPRTIRPEEAAKLTGMALERLRDVNGIPKGMLIRKGSTLLVPRDARQPHDVSEEVVQAASIALDREAPPAKRKSAVKSTQVAQAQSRPKPNKTNKTNPTVAAKPTPNKLRVAQSEQPIRR